MFDQMQARSRALERYAHRQQANPSKVWACTITYTDASLRNEQTQSFRYVGTQAELSVEIERRKAALMRANYRIRSVHPVILPM